MNTRSTAARHRPWLLFACLLAATAVAPAHSACKYKVNPNTQNNIPDFDPANGFSPTVVGLGLDGPLAPGATVLWTQEEGPTVVLNTANPAAPTFLAPNVTTSTTLRFRATVTCLDGSDTDVGTVRIINQNRPPVAHASASPAIALVGNTVTLSSTAPSGSPASNDPDGDTLFYQWTRTAGPAVTLTGATTATASFVAPNTGADYTLQFRLVVRDRPTGGMTSETSVVVNVTSNLPPLASLSCPEQVNEGAPVVLDGSASLDPNGQPLAYQWTQSMGYPSILVGGATTSTVTFTAPALTTGQDGFVEFELKVTDTFGLWDLATCMVEIRDITAPVISVPSPAPVAEAGSPDGTAVNYAVSAVDNVDADLGHLVVCVPPSGSVFPLGASPVDCEVDDSIGNTGSASFTVTVVDSTAPVIDSPSDIAVQATRPEGAIVNYLVPGGGRCGGCRVGSQLQ